MTTKRTETTSPTTRRSSPPRASAVKPARKATRAGSVAPAALAPEPPLVDDEASALDAVAASDVALEPPITDDTADVVDPDLRHRMISEVAYRRYAERNYADGYDFDDWLQAESEIDGLLRNPRRN